MIIVGLTGGIASGKSYVVSHLINIKIATHASDMEVRALYKEPSKVFLSFLNKEGFKEAVIKKNINKTAIRDKIFYNKQLKNKLEKFIHNEVSKKRIIFLKKHKRDKIVFLDIPLLFENKLEKICDYVCSTIAPIKMRVSRAMNRKGMNKKILNQIIKNQIEDKERKKKSNYLIDTSKTRTKTCLQVDKMIYDILKEKKHK